MSPSLAVLLLIALCSAHAIDVSTTKHENVQLTENDIVPKTQLKALVPEERGPGFIGDLIIGRRLADETVFRRIIEYNNPSNIVQTTTLSLTITNGVIHFLSAYNDPGSYAVICDTPYSLGSSKTNINLRIPPTSRSTLTLLIAAH